MSRDRVKCMKAFLRILNSTRRLLMGDGDRLIVVCGCTGTGKSELAIEIAKRFNGEIISADSMQIYKGLDIVTNKVTEEEMQGISHHMMSFYDPHNFDYNVHRFRDQSLAIIERILDDGKLPVVVGGTAYYLESVMYDKYLIADGTTKNDALRLKLEADYPTNDALYGRLAEVDPESAACVHRNNRARVMRALEIYFATGKPKSEHLREQRQPQSLFDLMTGGNQFGGKLRFRNTLLLNLDAEKAVLDERLDRRIDMMVERGLRRELEEFYDSVLHGQAMTDHGVLQSIGLKEFLPYLALDAAGRRTANGARLFAGGCEQLKLHTRQYCRKQRNWIYSRILLRGGSREVPENVTFNTSRHFFSDVVPQVLQVVDNFIAGRPSATDFAADGSVFMAPPGNATEKSKRLASAEYDQLANRVHVCELCAIEVHGEKGWLDHLAGRRHRAAKKRAADKSKVDENSNEGPPIAAI